MNRRTWGALVVAALAVAGCGSDDSTGEGSSPTSEATATTARASTTTGATGTTGRAQLTGLDPGFGEGGVRRVALSADDHDRFLAVATGPDGEVYAAGYVTSGGDQAMVVARLDEDGELDRDFGTDGVATVDVAPGGKTAEVARAVVVQPDGKVVIAGPAEHDPTATGDAAKDTDIFVVRFEPTGQPDTSFGDAGVARVDLGPGRAVSDTAFVGDTSWGLGLRRDGGVVVFGSTLAEGADRTDADYVFVGLTEAGAVDPAFGTGGTTRADLGRTTDNPRNVSVHEDGRIVGTGYSRDAAGVVSPVLVRLLPDGQLDPAFGAGGIADAQTIPGGVAESYAAGIQGTSYVSAGYGRGPDSSEKVDLVSSRFTADGTWDPTYGTAGLTRLDVAGQDDRGRNLVVLPDDRILVVGSGKEDAEDVDAMVVLLDEDGAPVPGFGTGGHLLSDLGGPADAWFGVALSADERSVFVVGYRGAAADSGEGDDAVVARLAL